MTKIEIFHEPDRLLVAQILVKNGYMVKQTRERISGKRSYNYYLEFVKTKPKEEAEE